MNSEQRQTIDKQLVENRFRASLSTYEESAVVQREISKQLVEFLENIKVRECPRVLEIGCCTGILTELFTKKILVDTLYLNDIVPEFCFASASRVTDTVKKSVVLPGDIEHLALPTNLDLVVSSSTLQWMSDLRNVFSRIAQGLNDNGIFLFALFGPGTMRELQELTGQGLLYHNDKSICSMLESWFQVEHIKSEQRVLYFETFQDVLRHIRKTGVGGLGTKRWSAGKLRELARRYLDNYLCDKGVPVSYMNTYCVCRKKYRVTSL